MHCPALNDHRKTWSRAIFRALLSLRIKILSSDGILVEKIIRAGRMKELRPVLGSGVADFAVWWELGVNSLRIWQP